MLQAQIIPVEPEPRPPPIILPDPPIKEPEPERLPDEDPLPNPDENPRPPLVSLSLVAGDGRNRASSVSGMVRRGE